MNEYQEKALCLVVVLDDGILVTDGSFPNAIVIFPTVNLAESAVAIYGGEARSVSEEELDQWKQSIDATGVCLSGSVPDEARFHRPERQTAWTILMPNEAFYTPQPNPALLSWLRNDRMRKLKEFSLKDTLGMVGHDLVSLLFDTAEDAERFIAEMPGLSPGLFKAVEVNVNEFCDAMTNGGCRFLNRSGPMCPDGKVPYNDYHLGLVDHEGQSYRI